MGLFVNQKDHRSQLQERIIADMREKTKNAGSGRESDNNTEDMKYLEGTKQTTTLAPAWIFIVIFAAVVVAMFLMQG